MSRKDYYKDPHAPKATVLKPATSALVFNDAHELLLQQRRDNELWALPGGTMEPGESIATCVVREVKEETGLDVKPESLIGIYSDPEHVIAYSDGEVRQQFSLCFSCSLVGGEIKVSEESYAVCFFPLQEVEQLNMHPTMRLRLHHYLEHRTHPFFS